MSNYLISLSLAGEMFISQERTLVIHESEAYSRNRHTAGCFCTVSVGSAAFRGAVSEACSLLCILGHFVCFFFMGVDYFDVNILDVI